MMSTNGHKAISKTFGPIMQIPAQDTSVDLKLNRVVVLWSDINTIVQGFSEAIRRRYGNQPLNIVSVMDGAVILTSYLTLMLLNRCWMSFVKVDSYDETLRPPDRPTIIIDDIANSGTTLRAVQDHYKTLIPNQEIQTLVLFKRIGCLMEIDYVGIAVPADMFLVGYGMDFQGEYRNSLDVRVYDKGEE